MARTAVVLQALTVLVVHSALAQSRPSVVPASMPEFSEVVRTPALAMPSLEVGDASLTPLEQPGAAASLSMLVKQALSSSPQLQQAQAVLQSFQSQRKAARADLLPNLSLRHAAGREQSVPAVSAGYERHAYAANTVRLTQPLYNRYVQHEYAATEQAQDGAAMRYRSAQENTILSVVRATVDLLTVRMTLDFSDAQLRQLQSILTYLENRAAAGASSQADLERARTRAYNARQIRVEQQAAYRNALFELERLTGQKPQAIELPGRKQWLPIQMGRQELLEAAYAANADIRALQHDVDAQRRRVDAEFSKYHPVVGISLEHDSSQNVQGNPGSRRDNRALLVMTWAASLGGKEWHLAQAADAELRQREARLRDEKTLLAQAVEADYSLLESSLLRVEAARLEQDAAARVVEAVAEQLKTGRLGSLLEALDASERLYGARQRLTQAIGQTFKAHAQLLQRTGRLTEDSLQVSALVNP